MSTSQMSHQNYRSLFWPIVLISAGVIWLLVNSGLISGQNLAVLFRLWPLILIVVGLDLLFGRRSPVIGALIGIGTVVLIVGLMLVGPSFGLSGPSLDVITDTYDAPVSDAESAQVNLNATIGELTIGALDDSANLMEAEVAHTGQMNFQDNEASQRTINLTEEDSADDAFGWNFFSGFFNDAENQRYWHVDFNPNVPLQLNINTGVGQSRLDLSALQLTSLSLNVGVGSVIVELPASAETLTAQIRAGVGETNVTIPEDAAVILGINGGVGSVSVDVPDHTAVRLEANTGLGNINVPGNFADLGESNDNQIWETPGFEAADQRITITFEGGIGNLTIH